MTTTPAAKEILQYMDEGDAIVNGLIEKDHRNDDILATPEGIVWLERQKKLAKSQHQPYPGHW